MEPQQEGTFQTALEHCGALKCGEETKIGSQKREWKEVKNLRGKRRKESNKKQKLPKTIFYLKNKNYPYWVNLPEPNKGPLGAQ